MADALVSRFWRPGPAYALAGSGIMLGLLVIVGILEPGWVFDPPWLLTTLSLVFLTVLPLAGAAAAVPAYRRSGAGAVLALGAGLLALGLGGGALPAILRFALDANAGLSFHNTSVLLAGSLQFAAALAAIFGTTLGRRRGLHAAAAYGAVVALVALLAVGVLNHVFPDFWAAGTSTPVRVAVLSTAAALWAGSALLWLPAAVRDRSVPFLDGYIAGLLLMALSFLALVAPQQLGDGVTWAARLGQYLGVAVMVGSLAGTLRPRPGSTEVGVAILQATLPFRPIVESASEGVVVIGRDGCVRFANDRALGLLGWSGGEVAGRDLAELMPTAGLEALGRLTGEWPAADAMRPLALGARLVEASKLGTADASVRVLLFRDVTNREHARDELEARVRERTEELERANAAKDEFLGLVSHELRTPITTITGLAAILGRKLASQDEHGLIADIESDAARLARIVDNLLLLARLEAGRAPETEPVALDRLAEEVVGRVRAEFRGRVVEVSAERGLVVEANAEQVAMVIRNYVVNALRYSAPSEAVCVQVARVGQVARLDVVDSGPGIAEADPMSLFEPFYRSPSTSGTPGVGIGLTVCRRIVESLGGEVTAESRTNERGAVFSFTLPLSLDYDLLPEPPHPEGASVVPA